MDEQMLDVSSKRFEIIDWGRLSLFDNWTISGVVKTASSSGKIRSSS